MKRIIILALYAIALTCVLSGCRKNVPEIVIPAEYELVFTDTGGIVYHSSVLLSGLSREELCEGIYRTSTEPNNDPIKSISLYFIPLALVAMISQDTTLDVVSVLFRNIRISWPQEGLFLSAL